MGCRESPRSPATRRRVARPSVRTRAPRRFPAGTGTNLVRRQEGDVGPRGLRREIRGHPSGGRGSGAWTADHGFGARDASMRRLGPGREEPLREAPADCRPPRRPRRNGPASSPVQGLPAVEREGPGPEAEGSAVERRVGPTGARQPPRRKCRSARSASAVAWAAGSSCVARARASERRPPRQTIARAPARAPEGNSSTDRRRAMTGLRPRRSRPAGGEEKGVRAPFLEARQPRVDVAGHRDRGKVGTETEKLRDAARAGRRPRGRRAEDPAPSPTPPPLSRCRHDEGVVHVGPPRHGREEEARRLGRRDILERVDGEFDLAVAERPRSEPA